MLRERTEGKFTLYCDKCNAKYVAYHKKCKCNYDDIDELVEDAENRGWRIGWFASKSLCPKCAEERRQRIEKLKFWKRWLKE